MRLGIPGGIRIGWGSGTDRESLTLHVAANAGGQSSSVLTYAACSRGGRPGGRCSSLEETVKVTRLDEWFDGRTGFWERVALKIDTQGFERQVLEGTACLLDENVVSLQLELSLVPLYEGSWLWDEAASWLKAREFRLIGVTPGFSDPATGTAPAIRRCLRTGRGMRYQQQSLLPRRLLTFEQCDLCW